jgi:hypothetical protein
MAKTSTARWSGCENAEPMTDESMVVLIVPDAFVPNAVAKRDPTRHALFPLRWSSEDEEDRKIERLSLALALGAGNDSRGPDRPRFEFVVVYARLRATRLRLASIVDAEFPWLLDNGLLWQCPTPFAAARASLVNRTDLLPYW